MSWSSAPSERRRELGGRPRSRGRLRGAPARAARGHRGALQRRHGRATHPPAGSAGRERSRRGSLRSATGSRSAGEGTTACCASRGRSPTSTAASCSLTRDLDEALSYRLDTGSEWRRDRTRAATPASGARSSSRSWPRGSPDCWAAATGGPRGLLGLPSDDLLARGGGRRVGEAVAFLDSLDVGSERLRLTEGGVHAPVRPLAALPAASARSDGPAGGAVRRRAAARRCAIVAEEPAVTVVGTRRASPYGTEVAYALGRGLGASGVPVVSGLALGHRRHGPPGLPRRRRRSGRGRGERAGRRVPAAAPLALRARARRRHRSLGAAARHRALPLELPGSEPDHGRARANDARGGGRATRVAA